jgi:hypothetical protein
VQLGDLVSVDGRQAALSESRARTAYGFKSLTEQIPKTGPHGCVRGPQHHSLQQEQSKNFGAKTAWVNSTCAREESSYRTI